MPRQRENKKPSRRLDAGEIWSDSRWRVLDGELRRRPGRPGRTDPLFETVAEKIPYEALGPIQKSMAEFGLSQTGIYLAHDSMGCVRYTGRGNIFQRLRARYRAKPDELVYFSFYVVREKVHEREIETLIIRAASPLLEFNDRKKRVGIEPGSVRDYEPGTFYYRRASASARSSSSD